jgi:hypothetical protein
MTVEEEQQHGEARCGVAELGGIVHSNRGRAAAWRGLPQRSIEQREKKILLCYYENMMSSVALQYIFNFKKKILKFYNFKINS